MKITFTTLILMMTLSGYVSADEKMKNMKPMTLTPEQRLSMATAHENMAACLRSDKALDVCHEEMMKACTVTVGKDGCSHLMGKGKMHDKK